MMQTEEHGGWNDTMAVVSILNIRSCTKINHRTCPLKALNPTSCMRLLKQTQEHHQGYAATI